MSEKLTPEQEKETAVNHEPITPEQAERLLKAIFAKQDTEELTAEDEAELIDDNYPDTIADKVGYAQYVLTHTLEYIGKSLNRLNRLDRLLAVAGRSGELPPIITHNELRMALEPLLHVEGDVKEITEMLTEVYKETKPEKKELIMREGERSCENCGNTRCANSIVAFYWDRCVDSNFEKYWMPKKEGEHHEND